MRSSNPRLRRPPRAAQSRPPAGLPNKWGRVLLRRLGLPANFDLLARGLEPLGADLQVDPRLVDGFQSVFEREVPVLEQFELLVELIEGLFVGDVLAHVSTSSTFAPRC